VPDLGRHYVAVWVWIDTQRHCKYGSQVNFGCILAII